MKKRKANRTDREIKLEWKGRRTIRGVMSEQKEGG